MSGIIIKRHFDDAVLFEADDAGSMKGALEAAVNVGAYLDDANLRGAYLDDANLRGANLEGANLRGAHLDYAYLVDANLRGAQLQGANLQGANLQGAHIRGAQLQGANLDGATRLPTGETWDEYLREVVPALLTAGGRTLAEVATEEHWDCHSWQNCPMHAAFGAADIADVPILLRPRAAQFIQFFDAKLIPLSAVLGEAAA